MPKFIDGALVAADVKIAMTVSRFNDFITNRLLEAALNTWERLGGNDQNVTVVRVPGSFEMPVTASKLAKSGRYEAVICLGCIIRGDTDHHEQVAGQAANGIRQVALETGVPVIFGVITAGTLDQAIDRAGVKQGNAGANAVLAAIEMVDVMKKIDDA